MWASKLPVYHHMHGNEIIDVSFAFGSGRNWEIKNVNNHTGERLESKKAVKSDHSIWPRHSGLSPSLLVIRTSMDKVEYIKLRTRPFIFV
jgi:hypothetical protein